MLLKSYNGQPIPGTDQVFRLNWAAYGVGKAQPAGEGERSPDACRRAGMRELRAPVAAAGPAQDPWWRGYRWSTFRRRASAAWPRGC